jgi:hypothetical protein
MNDYRGNGESCEGSYCEKGVILNRLDTRMKKQESHLAVVDASYDANRLSLEELKAIVGHGPRVKDGETESPTGMVKLLMDLKLGKSSRHEMVAPALPEDDEQEQEQEFSKITRLQISEFPEQLARRAKKAEQWLKILIPAGIVCGTILGTAIVIILRAFKVIP